MQLLPFTFQVLNIEGYTSDTCKQVSDLSNTLDYPDHYGAPLIKSFDCKNNRNNDGKGCLFIVDTADDSILGVQQSKLRWERSEALANVIATEFIDLPLADSEGALESEMKGKSGKFAIRKSQRFQQNCTRRTYYIHDNLLVMVGEAYN